MDKQDYNLVSQNKIHQHLITLTGKSMIGTNFIPIRQTYVIPFDSSVIPKSSFFSMWNMKDLGLCLSVFWQQEEEIQKNMHHSTLLFSDESTRRNVVESQSQSQSPLEIKTEFGRVKVDQNKRIIYYGISHTHHQQGQQQQISTTLVINHKNAGQTSQNTNCWECSADLAVPIFSDHQFLIYANHGGSEIFMQRELKQSQLANKRRDERIYCFKDWQKIGNIIRLGNNRILCSLFRNQIYRCNSLNILDYQKLSAKSVMINCQSVLKHRSKIFSHSVIPVFDDYGNGQCFTTAEYDLEDNCSVLKIFDCRQKKHALILDSSYAQIAGKPNWSPNHHLLAKYDGWKVSTIWGKMGFRKSGICLIDMRKPLSKMFIYNQQSTFEDKQITVENPKFLWCENKHRIWMVQNCFEGYRYLNKCVKVIQLEK